MSKRSSFLVVWRTKNSGKSNKIATVQIIAIHIMARPGWGLYRRGKQIAYHLSIEMNVNVKIDTVTLTVCGNIKKIVVRMQSRDNRLELLTGREILCLFCKHSSHSDVLNIVPRSHRLLLASKIKFSAEICFGERKDEEGAVIDCLKIEKRRNTLESRWGWRSEYGR